MVLAARWAKIHVAMVHKDGVWSTRTSGGSQEGDLMLFLTDKGICEAEPIPIADLSVVGGEWTESPPVIHLAVWDIAEATQCTGFKPHQQEPESLLSVLSAFLGLGLCQVDSLVFKCSDGLPHCLGMVEYLGTGLVLLQNLA